PNSHSSSPGLRADSRSSEVLDAVRLFAERLAELPAWSWVEVGNALLRDGSSNERRATASALLGATISSHGLAVIAWYACDAIETSAFYASLASGWTRDDRRAFAAARAAAEDMALALLAREFLPGRAWATLSEPFALLPQPTGCG